MKRFAAVADDVSNVSGGIDGDEEIATATAVVPLSADEILTVTLPGSAADFSLVGDCPDEGWVAPVQSLDLSSPYLWKPGHSQANEGRVVCPGGVCASLETSKAAKVGDANLCPPYGGRS
jgi:hypothetical protein